MADENEALSHGDMWDDSALVDSWNQALEEYKVSEGERREQTPLPLERARLTPSQKYHSIHAKGLPLDEVSLE